MTQFKIISAPPGEPSVMWIGKSGRMYRTVVAAKIDKAGTEYAPPVAKSTTKNYIFWGLAALIVILIIYKLIK